MALDEPCKDTGMEDYRLDQRGDPQHHPAAVKRLTEPKRRSYREAVSSRLRPLSAYQYVCVWFSEGGFGPLVSPP